MSFDTSLLECRSADGEPNLIDLMRIASDLGRRARAAGKPMSINPFWNKDDSEIAARHKWNNAWMSEHIRMCEKGVPEPEEPVAA